MTGIISFKGISDRTERGMVADGSCAGRQAWRNENHDGVQIRIFYRHRGGSGSRP